jgi:hypothetical protein
MRKISIREVSEIGDDGYAYVSGLIADIEPPVRVSESAVSQYVRHGRLDKSIPDTNERLANPMLIGDGDAQTSIYVSHEYGFEPSEVSELFANRVAGLLGHLGIESEIM